MDSLPRRLMLLLAASALLLAPLLTIQLATGAGRAHGCSCALPPPPLEALDGASAVFEGRVASFETYSFEVDFGSDRTDRFWSVEFDVDTVWKGSIASTTFVYVWHEPACGYGNFEIGEDFLVYTIQREFDQVGDDTLYVSFCSRTQPLERAQGDLADLGGGQAPEPGVTGARPASQIEEQATASDTTGTSTTSADDGQTPAAGDGAASESPQRGPTLATTGSGPAPEVAGQTSGSSTTDAASTSGDSSTLPAWSLPLLVAVAAAAILIRLAVRPRRQE